MITYEDAIKRTGEMPTKTASLRMVPRADVDILISELFDQQDELQQHIKSLEAQLANAEQLTCGTCSYFSWDGRGIGQCHNYSPQCPMYTLTDFGCIFHTHQMTPKDTKWNTRFQK